jgi:hypothetical protein
MNLSVSNKKDKRQIRGYMRFAQKVPEMIVWSSVSNIHVACRLRNLAA